MRVIEKFSEEKAGLGKGNDASKYNYFVEELKNGSHVILTRPANLKNGFDFLIRVENFKFSNNKDYPKHDDIINDLNFKKTNESENYKLLYDSIKKVFTCNEIVPEMHTINFSTGLSAELLLYVLKWFFIEQDIRYWNYSGRGMLMSGIPEPII
jgi:hypothetical protein